MQVVNAATTIMANPALVFDMFDEFATDISLETGGAMVPYKGDTKFKLARANNTEYGEAISKALAEHSDSLSKGGPEAEALNVRLMIDVVANTILKGWENVTYMRKPFPYSLENAKVLLAHNDFRVWVKRQSENREYFKAKMVEEVAKN